MTYLQLVQYALRKGGVREDFPTTLVGATGIVDDFAEWVKDAWFDIQHEELNPPWWFRMVLDQTLAVNAGDDDYAMPSGLETLDWRSITVYLTAKQDETPVHYIPYDRWRILDTRAVSENRPQCISLTPDNVLRLYPVPDQDYTLRFDGVREIQELALDADTPTGLMEQYHRTIAWKAVMLYAAHHEDGSMYGNAKDRYQPIYDRMKARQKVEFRVEKGHLYDNPRS